MAGFPLISEFSRLPGSLRSKGNTATCRPELVFSPAFARHVQSPRMSRDRAEASGDGTRGLTGFLMSQASPSISIPLSSVPPMFTPCSLLVNSQVFKHFFLWEAPLTTQAEFSASLATLAHSFISLWIVVVYLFFSLTREQILGEEKP